RLSPRAALRTVGVADGLLLLALGLGSAGTLRAAAHVVLSAGRRAIIEIGRARVVGGLCDQLAPCLQLLRCPDALQLALILALELRRVFIDSRVAIVETELAHLLSPGGAGLADLALLLGREVELALDGRVGEGVGALVLPVELVE